MSETVPTISIVISTFNRNPQLAATLASIRAQEAGREAEVIVVDDGDRSHGHPSAELVCQTYGARYLRCRRPPSLQFRNPSLPNNIGIRAARGEVVILQNAECLHRSPDTISLLTAPVLASLRAVPRVPPVVTFAHVVALDPAGSPAQTYCSPAAQRPYFFCGAVSRALLVRLRGFDEDYTGAGYDDDDLAARLAGEGAEFRYLDPPVVHHQWHHPAGAYADAGAMRDLFEEKCAAMIRGELGTVRNVGRTWGGQP